MGVGHVTGVVITNSHLLGSLSGRQSLEQPLGCSETVSRRQQGREPALSALLRFFLMRQLVLAQ